MLKGRSLSTHCVMRESDLGPVCPSEKVSGFVEHDSTACHMDTIREVLVIKVLSCLLQSDDVTRNVLLDGCFFSASGSGFHLLMLSLFRSVKRTHKRRILFLKEIR